MEESKKASDGTSSNTTDWEVVSLTASTYAASPGPVKYELPNESIDKEFEKNEKEPYDTNFMSQYFVSAKNEYEVLNIEAKHSELHDKIMQEDVFLGEKDVKESGRSLEGSCKITLDDNLHGIDLFEKENKHSDSDIEFGKGKALHEEILFSSSNFKAFNAQTGESFRSNRGADVPDSDEISSHNEDQPPDHSYASEEKENEHIDSEPQSKSWWKKHAIALYNYAKEPDRFWSILVTAAFVGLVILGQRRQRGKSELEELKFHININKEGTNSMLKPVNFKSIVINDHQCNSLVDGSIKFSTHGAY